MKRLPSYDRHTSHTERALFLSLGLAALGLIYLTGSEAVRFFGQQPDTTAIVSSGSAADQMVVNTNVSSTNITVVHSGSLEERTRLDRGMKPKS